MANEQAENLEKLKAYRKVRQQIQQHYLDEEHPGWIAWTVCVYKRKLANEIQKKMENIDWLTEEQLEQAVLSLGIEKISDFR